jgi:SAM-dependent methyltransferase
MIEIRHQNMEKTEDTKLAYDSIYSQEGIQLKDSFYLWIISLLPLNSEKIFLDVSCGYGKLVYFASKKTNKVLGIDFSISAIKKAKSLYPELNWEIGDGEKLPFKSSSIDIVTNIGSIEHFQNPDKGIREIKRVLKKNGIACIFLPNGFSLLGNIKYVMFNGDVFDDGQPLQRYNTKLGWKKLLEKNGLKPIKVLPYERSWPRTTKDIIWYFTHPIKMAHMLLGYFIPSNLINCFVYLCVKIDNE